MSKTEYSQNCYYEQKTGPICIYIYIFGIYVLSNEFSMQYETINNKQFCVRYITEIYKLQA